MMVPPAHAGGTDLIAQVDILIALRASTFDFDTNITVA
jgi:hypothetical protein